MSCLGSVGLMAGLLGLSGRGSGDPRWGEAGEVWGPGLGHPTPWTMPVAWSRLLHTWPC